MWNKLPSNNIKSLKSQLAKQVLFKGKSRHDIEKGSSRMSKGARDADWIDPAVSPIQKQ